MFSNEAIIRMFKEQLEKECETLIKQHDLSDRGQAFIWWYFIKLLGLAPEQVEEIVCDGGGDLGIDAVDIDDDNFVHFYQFKNPEKIEKDFPAGDVDKVIEGLRLIFEGDYKKLANKDLIGRIEEVKQELRNGYRLHLVSGGGGISLESIEKLQVFGNRSARSSDK